MRLLSRIARHIKISCHNLGIPATSSPPFLILFITSKCNFRCEHCFYWKDINKRDDLTFDEIRSLSNELGKIENLNISGGEPFLREEFAEICRFFIINNQVEQIYVPTNAYFTDKILASVDKVLKESSLKLFVVEISLDGTGEFHNLFRGSEESFQNAMKTYDALVDIQKIDPRLRIHAVSTVTEKNINEIGKLTTFLYSRCPAMDHHNIALIRGYRKNASLQGPDLVAYEKLHEYTSRLWAPREKGRYGAIVEPMLQWAKVTTLRKKKQIIPCRAGKLSAVVYANGDVGICESHPPLGNLRQKNFKEIWYSKEAKELRCSIGNKECYCSNEIFMWPSITFQPLQLLKAMLRAKVWRKPVHLKENEKYEEFCCNNHDKEDE